MSQERNQYDEGNVHKGFNTHFALIILDHNAYLYQNRSETKLSCGIHSCPVELNTQQL